MGLSPGLSRSGPFFPSNSRCPVCRRALLEFFDHRTPTPTPKPRAMVIISPAVDDADLLAAANGACAPRPAPAANNFEFDPAAAAALSLFDVARGTTATADVGAGTTPWWSSPPPYYAGSGAYASSSFPPPPLQSHGDDLACCYAGSIMDTSFPQLPAPPPAVYMQPELSYFYYRQELLQGLPSCFAAPIALEPTTIRPEVLQVPTTTQPASMPPPPPPSLYYPQTQGAMTGSASVEEASPAPSDTQRAQEDDTRPAPRRRGRPSKRAPAVSVSEPPVSKPTKRVAVGRNRAAASSTSQKTSSSAATGSATMSSSSAGQVPDKAGASSSSTGGSTSGQQIAACTGTNSSSSMALLCQERCHLQWAAISSNGAPAPAGVVVQEGHHHQQAAIAQPPEATVTGPPYADTSGVGVRFHPTDQELIFYLRQKYARQQMPVEFFKDLDVYQAHPMAIRGACGDSQNGCWYAFSPRDRKYRNGKRPARSVFAEGGGRQQVGFWKSNSKLGDVRAGGKRDGAVIGRMTSLTFQLGRQPRGKQTGWKMKEYTIPENQHQPDGSAMLLNDWVVCKLFYKERPRCTNRESKKDVNATSVGQKRPRHSRKSKKDKNAIPVAVGQKEDGPGEKAAGESVQGEEDVQPQMVPADHQQAPDYSEQDLCVEDYLVCDVAFAQQNDTGNCTV